jgi:predicted TIM-barrel fold metal-dependent hydrolase
MTSDGNLSRRTLLVGTSALLANLQGCGTILKDQICRMEGPFAPNDSDLVVDAHAHFFNSSDVHVRRILDPVMSKGEPYEDVAKHLADFVQHFGWTLAPDARRERDLLAEIRQIVKQCAVLKEPEDRDGRLAATIGRARQEAYVAGREQVAIAARKALSRRKGFIRSEQLMLQLEDALPRDAEDYFFDDPSTARSKMRSFLRSAVEASDNIMEFVLRQLQYRAINFFDYLRYMSTGSDRSVDLAIAHLLDFDYPLGNGSATPTPVVEQIRLMSELTVVSQGRVHGFAPFCPMKAVVHRTGPSPLSIVQDAIEDRGFIGVKIYPPMGFAPLGNAEIQRDRPDFWSSRDWLPQSIRTVADLGARMDEELLALYRWCQRAGVPIMSHTNVSLGPHEDFEALVDSAYWDHLLTVVPGLRINFGHFGNTKPASSLERTRKFMNVMRRDPEGATKFVYADSGYFTEFVHERQQLEAALRNLRNLYGGSAPRLFDRFMFGTDWEMVTLVSRSANEYLSAFENVIDAVVPRNSADEKVRFFGNNAAAYLGLARGEQTRRRLERFYFRNSIATPEWMRKADQIA